jgi:argininosuccinate lyase
MMPSIQFNREAMAAGAREGFMEATDLADYLVAKGLPFREAHKLVGSIVLHCAKTGRRLSDLSVAEYRRFSPLFDEYVTEALSIGSIIERRGHPGGTSPKQVQAALRRARRRLS